jgi:hypothetical protein
VDRTPMTAQWLAYMQDAGKRREEAIIRDMLQQPDYPPLAPCPSCDVPPEEILSRIEDPEFGQFVLIVLVDFKPCGHGFRALANELLNI